ncbi:chondroitinase-B domain-containing protein [Kangiella sp.]|uniref:chondroitinase-B domain-containing protein n=1 Tax=Kangiella sp. TaxID=1920245 RepID=UPI003A91F664
MGITRMFLIVGLLLQFLIACKDDRVNTIELSKDIYGRKLNTYKNIDCINRNSCVSNAFELKQALVNREEHIILKNGYYDLGVIEVDYPVKISSSELGGAIVTGSSYVKITANDVVIEGLAFLNGGSPSGGTSEDRHGAIFISSNHVLIENNFFESIGINTPLEDKTGIGILISGSQDIIINNNTFKNSQAIAIASGDYSKYIRVIYNDFLNSYYFGGAGEVVHFGDATSVRQGEPPFLDDTYHEFANNFVSNWNLEKELISIKSNKNKIYNNYFRNNSFSAIVVRMGNDNQIFNNVMVGNSIFPFRISGERNLFENNKVCGSGAAVSLHAEMVYTEFRPDLYNSYWAAKDNVFQGNRFYGYNKLAILDEGDATASDYLASYPENNVFKNNVFVSKDYFDASFPGTVLLNNLILHDHVKCPF